MPLRVLYTGPTFTIAVYVRETGSSPTAEYLDQLAVRQRKKVEALLRYTANNGPPRNPEKSAALEGVAFFEFKAGQVRIFWDYAPNRQIVLFHGFTKKSQSTPRNELALGQRRWRETINELGN